MLKKPEEPRMNHIRNTIIANLISFILLFIGISLVSLAVFMIPYVFWAKVYEMPEIIWTLQHMLYQDYGFSLEEAIQTVFGVMLITGLISLILGAIVQKILRAYEKRQLEK
jgi:hypothetical protein